jgi:four helix bundle protein
MNELQKRTKMFALKIIRLVEKLPKTRIAVEIGNQLLKSATSVGANYRAACRARSLSDFIAKMGIVEEELDESIYWIELLVESHSIELREIESLLKAGDELLAMIVSSIKTARKSKSPRPYRRGIQKNQEYLHSPCHPELVSGSDLFFRF